MKKVIHSDKALTYLPKQVVQVSLSLLDLDGIQLEGAIVILAFLPDSS